jgi:glycosyltransferase involved in cell wall biosynthesis
LKKNAKLIITWHEVWKKRYWSEYAGNFIGNFGYLIQKLCAKSADRIIAVSNHTKKDVVNLLGVNEKKLSVIPNGIDLELIKKTPGSKEKSDIIFVGRLIPEKNVDVLLKAICLVKEKIPRIKGIIIGEGPELKKLVSLRDKLELENNVKFMKFLDEYKIVLSLIKSSNVFVTASIREGFGIVIIEAMACGLPIIAVKHPSSAVPDLIENGGILTDLDPGKIGNEIIKVLRKRGYRKRLSKNALEISEKYDWEKILKAFSFE